MVEIRVSAWSMSDLFGCRINNLIMNTFGERLKTLRERAGLNQDELAQRMGISSKSIVHWEDGTRSLDVGSICRLAKAMGIHAAYFMYDRLSSDFEKNCLIEEQDGRVRIVIHKTTEPYVKVIFPKEVSSIYKEHLISFLKNEGWNFKIIDTE